MGRPWETPAPGRWHGVPGRLALRSVQSCEREEGTLLLWLAGTEGTGRLLAKPMRCGSWRCRRCSWKVGRFDFDRITKAVEKRKRWLYCVFTFDPKAMANPWDAYRKGYELWDRRLKRRLERRFGELEYLQTWEAHGSGWPHLNLLLAGEGLMAHLDTVRSERRWAPAAGHGRGRWATWTAFRKELRGMVSASGMQRADWVEIMDNPDGFAAYFAKLAHELTSARLKKGDQSPIMAPRHFRRFRGSAGLIPPPRKIRWLRDLDEETGEVSWSARTTKGEGQEWTALPLARPWSEFANRDPTWSGDYLDALEYKEASRTKRARIAADRAAGKETWSGPELET